MAKFKIFLGFFTIAIILMFLVQVVNFLDDSFSVIDDRKKDFSCSKSSFEINLFESEKTAAIEVNSLNENISKVTIITDSETIIREFNPPIPNGNSRNLMINSSKDGYYIFINDCNNTGVKK